MNYSSRVRNFIHDYFGITAIFLSMSCIILSPLALGAVHPKFISIFTTLALLSLLLHIIERTSKKRKVMISWLGMPIFLGFLFSLSMLIPLPLWLRNFLAPSGTEKVEWIKSLLSVEAQSKVLPVLSLDPPETAIRLLQMITAVCIFIVVADKARRKSNRKIIFYFLLTGGLLLFAIAAGHRLGEIPKIWGHYQTGNTPFFAPMINPNHLATVFGIFSFVCLAGIYETKEKIESFWFLLGTTLCGSGSILTLSRGGILAFFAIAFAIVLFATLHNLRHRRDLQIKNKALALPVGMFVFTFIAIGTAFFVATDAISNELGTIFNENALNKLQLFKPAWATFKDNWIFGIAPGSLSSVFFSNVENSVENQSLFSGNFNVPFFENTFVQTAIDHGLFKTLILFTVILWVLFVLFKHNWQYFEDKILILALFFVLLSDVVDFAFETGAVLWLVSLILALCSARLASRRFNSSQEFKKHRSCVASEHDQKPSESPQKQNFPLRTNETLMPIGKNLYASKSGVFVYINHFLSTGILAILVMSTLVYAPLATTYFTPKLNQDFQKLDDTTTLVSVESALAKHPLHSYYAYLLARISRIKKNYKKGLVWAQVSTKLRPTQTNAHLEAARINYFLQNKEQSLNDYRQAWISNTSYGPKILEEAIILFPNIDKLKSILPYEAASFLNIICFELRKKKRFEEAQGCFDRILFMTDADESQRQMSAQQAYERKDYLGALKRAKIILGNDTPNGDLAVLIARALEKLEGRSEAFLLVNYWLQNAKDDLPLLWHKFNLARSWGDFEEAWATLSELENYSSVTATSVMEHKISLYISSNQIGKALQLVKQQVTLEKLNASRLMQQANLELLLGFINQAEATYKKMSILFPKNKIIASFGKQIKLARKTEEERRLKALLVR